MNCKWYLLNWTEIIFLVIWQRPWLSEVCRLLTAQCTEIFSIWTHNQCFHFCFGLIWSCEILSKMRIGCLAVRIHHIPRLRVVYWFCLGDIEKRLQMLRQLLTSLMHCTMPCWKVVVSQDSSASNNNIWANLDKIKRCQLLSSAVPCSGSAGAVWSPLQPPLLAPPCLYLVPSCLPFALPSWFVDHEYCLPRSVLQKYFSVQESVLNKLSLQPGTLI